MILVEAQFNRDSSVRTGTGILWTSPRSDRCIVMQSQILSQTPPATL